MRQEKISKAMICSLEQQYKDCRQKGDSADDGNTAAQAAAVISAMMAVMMAAIPKRIAWAVVMPVGRSAAHAHMTSSFLSSPLKSIP
jgi:hypothetical protein